MSTKQSPLQRIKRVMDFYYKQGANKESVNNVYKKIIKIKFNKENAKDYN
jgi:hypothetical protein